MEWLIVLVIIWFLFYALTRKNTGGRSTEKSSGSGKSSGNGTNFLPPTPKGFQIYAERLSVVGVKYRGDDALRFADDSGQTLALEPEPENPHDPNAVKVIGIARGTRRFIGYVPKETAEQIVGSGLADAVQARLERIWRSGDGFVDVTFQIVGPKARKAQWKTQYDNFLKNKTADVSQKEFLKFFGLPVTKGLTSGRANELITEHRTKLETEDKALLDEWDAYVEICDEFDDAEFRTDHDLKKISHALLKEVLGDLKRSGDTMRSLASDIEQTVERIIALKPDIEKK